MSLLLSWENPTELFSRPQRAAVVSRWLGQMNPAIVTRDSPWGMCEDTENDDPLARYQVDYVNADGSPAFSVLDRDIRRQRDATTLCRITFELVRADGFPDAGREISASDDAGGSGLYHRTVATNQEGKAFMVFRPGVRLLFRLEGAPMALDVAIPSRPLVTWAELIELGSQVPTDMRGRF